MEEELDYEELMKLSSEEFKKYMKEREQEYYDNVSFIDGSDYPQFSLEQKINFWCETLNTDMREQTKGGFDPYAIFSKMWYIAAKRDESNIEMIMNEVFKKFQYYGWEWDKNEYLKRINSNS